MSKDSQPLIWALDVATITGLAIGRVGETPSAKSIRLAPAGSTSTALFVGCLTWFENELERGPLPDILAIEELLPPTARRGATSTSTQHRLAGLHGIIRALAGYNGIPEVVGVNVGAVRQHFIHRRGLPRDAAKREVLQMCKHLGWPAGDNNCGDALALWSYTAAVIDPATALYTTPLFGQTGPTWEDVARDREAKQRG